MRKVVEAFNRRHDRIHVDYLAVSQVDQKLLLSTAGRDPPDVAGVWDYNVVVYADHNAIRPLDQHPERDGLGSDHYLKAYWDLCHHQQRTYALPTTPASVALFNFMHVWNDFLGPLISLTDQKMYTLANGLQAYQSQYGGTQWPLLMAASPVVVIPVIVLFFFAQKTFVQGITVTGIKR